LWACFVGVWWGGWGVDGWLCTDYLRIDCWQGGVGVWVGLCFVFWLGWWLVSVFYRPETYKRGVGVAVVLREGVALPGVRDADAVADAGDDEELARIRRRKLQALLEERRRREEARREVEARAERRQRLLRAIFEPGALAYLEKLKVSKPGLAARIEDIALYLFMRRQLVYRITREGVVAVQRRLEGVGPRIMVKRRGEEAVSLYEAVRRDLSERGGDAPGSST